MKVRLGKMINDMALCQCMLEFFKIKASRSLRRSKSFFSGENETYETDFKMLRKKPQINSQACQAQNEGCHFSAFLRGTTSSLCTEIKMSTQLLADDRD